MAGVSHLLGLGHHLSRWHRRYLSVPPLALPREAIILDAQADVCGPALMRVGAPCDHVPAKFRLPLALEGAQSHASPSAISIDDSEQEAAPIERGASWPPISLRKSTGIDPSLTRFPRQR